MRSLWLTLLIFGLPASPLQAATFTAVQRVDDGPDRFLPDSVLTVTVYPGDPEAVITFPSSILNRYPWPPPVAFTLNGAEARNADCHFDDYTTHRDPHSRYCQGKLTVTILGDGRAEVRVPRQWFLEAATLPYRIHKRYHTCLETEGEKDIFYPIVPPPGFQRCPAFDPNFSWFDPNKVHRPLTGWLTRIQHGGYPWTEEFIFQDDLPGSEANVPPEWQPEESQYGELERIYSWVEEQTLPAAAPAASQILTHVFAGPLATSTAKTEITITNRTGQPCNALVRFHQGTAEAAQVRFNGRQLDNNTLEATIPAAHSQKLTLTRDAGQDLAVGAVYIQESPDCAADALQVEGRYLITRQDGEIMEAFSILPQKPTDWLSNGDCRIMAVDFGPNSNVGLAMVTAAPDMPAPAETRLSVQEYDWQGNDLGSLSVLQVTGKHQALNPWTFTEPRLLKMCLEVPDDPNGFRLSMIAIAASTSSRNVQYSSQALIPLN